MSMAAITRAFTQQAIRTGPAGSLPRTRYFSRSCPTRKPFKLSDIGEGINEVSVIQWYRKPGDVVEEFDQLVEVSSDKATVDITAPWSGTLSKFYGQEGDTIRVGEFLCDIDEAASDDEPTSPPSASAVSSAVETTVETLPTSSTASSSSSESAHSDRADVSPATRFLARKHDIDLRQVKGTGKNGRITKSDILHLTQEHHHDDRLPTHTIPVVSTSPSPLNTPNQTDHALSQAGQIMPLEPFRHAMYKAMTASLRMPHFAYSDEIDVTDAERFRVRLNKSIPHKYRETLPAKAPETERVAVSERFDRITLLPILVKAMSQALRDNLIFTSTYDTTRDIPSLHYRSSHDISIALSASNGALFTPLIPSVDRLSIFDIASRIALLQRTSPRFTPDMLKPGTITLSNIGTIGGTYTHPVIPPTGQLSIGAFGRVKPVLAYTEEETPLAKAAALDTTGQIDTPLPRPRLQMAVSFTADHRFVAGTELAQLVAAWKRYLEQPDLMLGSMR